MGRFGSAYRRQVSRQHSGGGAHAGTARQDSSMSGGDKKLAGASDDEEEEEEKFETPSILRVLTYNAPEWPYLLFGTLGAAGSGVIMPTFAIVFAKLLRVGHSSPPKKETHCRLF